MTHIANHPPQKFNATATTLNFLDASGKPFSALLLNNTGLTKGDEGKFVVYHLAFIRFGSKLLPVAYDGVLEGDHKDAETKFSSKKLEDITDDNEFDSISKKIDEASLDKQFKDKYKKVVRMSQQYLKTESFKNHFGKKLQFDASKMWVVGNDGELH